MEKINDVNSLFNSQNFGYLSTNRALRDLDLEIDYSEEKQNNIIINDNHENNMIENEENQNNNNIENNDSQNGDSIDDNNGNNIKESYKAFFDIINDLKNNNLFFIKDFYDQKLNENNIFYNKWLKNLYLNLYSEMNKNDFQKLNVNQKIELPNISEIKEKLEKKLFFCLNCKCKSISYINPQLKLEIEKIPNLNFKENFTSIIKGYKKLRCPICLKYKCIYCKQTSTLQNANCCYIQLFNACYNANIDDISPYFCFNLAALYIPIIRVWYIGFNLNFFFFRALNQKKYLLLNKKDILSLYRRKNNNRYNYGLYIDLIRKRMIIPYNILHIAGTTFWAITYLNFIEFILIISMITSFIIGIKYFKKVINVFYILLFTPGIFGRSGYIEEK